jgi:hypothetical protein
MHVHNIPNHNSGGPQQPSAFGACNVKRECDCEGSKERKVNEVLNPKFFTQAVAEIQAEGQKQGKNPFGFGSL